MYDLETGQMFTLMAQYHGTGKGEVAGPFANGESLSGEWVLVRQMVVGWGSVYGSVYGPGGYASGSGTAVSVAASGKAYGTAILRGDKGSILDCEFVVGAGNHGAGACKNKDGKKYKLMF